MLSLLCESSYISWYYSFHLSLRAHISEHIIVKAENIFAAFLNFKKYYSFCNLCLGVFYYLYACHYDTYDTINVFY